VGDKSVILVDVASPLELIYFTGGEIRIVVALGTNVFFPTEELLE
jgi:hypothetical protein